MEDQPQYLFQGPSLYALLAESLSGVLNGTPKINFMRGKDPEDWIAYLMEMAIPTISGFQWDEDAHFTMEGPFAVVEVLPLHHENDESVSSRLRDMERVLLTQNMAPVPREGIRYRLEQGGFCFYIRDVAHFFEIRASIDANLARFSHVIEEFRPFAHLMVSKALRLRLDRHLEWEGLKAAIQKDLNAEYLPQGRSVYIPEI